MKKRYLRVYCALFVTVLVFGGAPTDGFLTALISWPLPNANSQGTNFVSQTGLTRDNAANLKLAWNFTFPAPALVDGLNLTGQGAIAPPLLVDGTVFVALNELKVLALDAKNGSTLWSYQPVLNRSDLPLGILAGHVHGLVFDSGKIWLSLPDCTALALDAKTGKVAEQIARICAEIPGNSGKYDYSGAPMAFSKDMMIWTASSVSEGTDAGRGFVAAYNITTGHLIWRWYVVPPAGGDPNWDSNSCSIPCYGNVAPYPGDWGNLGMVNGQSRAGAGPSWGQPVIDSKDGLVILGTSQPSPDWNATFRRGPNLYSDSIVALNMTDGKLVWFIQATPHDIYDFDCGWNVALAALVIDGVNSTVVFKACKNGYLYAIRAQTGKLLWYFDPPSVVRQNSQNADYVSTGKYNATQPWTQLSLGAIEQCPGINGAIESDISVAYGKVFVATYNFCAFVTVGPVNSIGGSVSGAKTIAYDFGHANTTFYALDASTGRVSWSYYLNGIPYRGWLTSTGGMVLASTLNGQILALDGSTGDLVGSTLVGAKLYEGVTIGTDETGAVRVLQLTSPPAYGAFGLGAAGSLLAFTARAVAPSGAFSSLWVVGGIAAGVATVVFLYGIFRRRKLT